jgi:hypothetical protein
MLNKALYGRLPTTPPAPLEEIIDSAVKTGADLSPVVSWNYANTREILESRIPIPALLHKRLSVDWADKENRPPLPRTSGVGSQEAHWLDRLEAGIQAHIRQMEEQREAFGAGAAAAGGVGSGDAGGGGVGRGVESAVYGRFAGQPEGAGGGWIGAGTSGGGGLSGALSAAAAGGGVVGGTGPCV